MRSRNIDTLQKIFENVRYGELEIHSPEGQVTVFKGTDTGPKCDIQIHDWDVVNMVKKRGDIGLGEAYHLGLWDSSDTSEFLHYCSINLEYIKNRGDASILNKLIFILYNNIVYLNTKYGSKKNILKHYDIGNEFYKLWLDSTMTYSSGIRNNIDDDLTSAQLNKYNKIINNLEITDKSVLEIGCGWGGFLSVASNLGSRLTGITISNQQYAYSKKRLGNNADVLLKDYRLSEGKYDRIVSIEMFEAVGEKYWPTYFNQIKKLLVKNGRAIIQTINIDDRAFYDYRKNSDYIRHHVFPGGMLPSKSVFCQHATKAGLGIGNIHEFGQDYAWTLEQWKYNFKQQSAHLKMLNYTAPFLRAWEFYFCMAIAGFKSGRTNVMQIELHN